MFNKLFKTNAAHATILLKKIISLAVNQGFIGFGGKCGQAAIAMNHVLFDNTLSYVGIFNKALAEEGYTIGHIALEFDSKTSLLLDIDGIASIETLEHWGMLDVTDSDIIDLYTQ